MLNNVFFSFLTYGLLKIKDFSPPKNPSLRNYGRGNDFFRWLMSQ